MSLLSLLEAEYDSSAFSALESELERLLAEDPGGTGRIDVPHYEFDADDVSLLAQYRRSQQRTNEDSRIDWLRSNLRTGEMFEKALACLTSAASDDAIQDQLLEICGYELIDVVGQAIQKRTVIRQEAQDRDQRLVDALSAQPKLIKPTSIALNGRHQEDQEMQDRLKAQLLEARKALLQSQQRTYGHTPAAQIQFTSASDKRRARDERKAAVKLKKLQLAEGEDVGYTAEQLEQIRLESLDAAASRPLYDPDATRVEELPQYPHVYTATRNANAITFLGQRYSLPLGTTRHEEKSYWEVTIPTPAKLPMREGEELIRIDELDPIAKGSFPGYKTLNRLQSLVYPVAYQSNENMLVCAPTGAGKTDVAMLTVLRALSHYADDIQNRPVVSASDFKVIYVAPMKALAAEIVRKMSKRLSWLGVLVRELTGDMQLTRAEIAATHFIVTTPEKWDVVTRKPEGDAELAGKVRLLIIDEVHLLHDERGAVIESIVARTLRQVESSQLMIRIVGLSATLPNYMDVADFLRVNRFSGLFYFDSSFRPVPLEQHFLGVKGKTGSPEMRRNLDEATYDKVRELVKQGHQVMVFVHSRKDTVKTAEMLRMRFREEQDLLDIIDPTVNPRYELFKRDLASSRNREMKELFESGFGHHAGMLRSDRTLSERLFEQDVTKVLVCTATLAWGVNLPAYAVVIKGTQIFDSAKGSFTDISILDVLQIFGRAGRPQYETHGVGFICTAYDKMDHYVSAITQQHPIESKFEVGLLESLNAEIALGTVTSVDAGVRWIGYTYLFVRMRKNPLAYGINREELLDDPSLGSKRHQQITSALKQLVRAKMVIFDEQTGLLSPTELGKIASKYYLRYASVEIYNEKFISSMTEADALRILSLSVEFGQLKVRESELDDLRALEEVSPFSIGSSAGTTEGKVNVLLQAYISRRTITDFALISDMGFVSQNAGRVARALLDIAISRRWSSTTAVMSSLCKAIEARRWSSEHPLFQIPSLSAEVLYNASRYLADFEIADIISTPAGELGDLLHLNERAGTAVLNGALQLPRLTATYLAQPLASDLLRISVELKRDFEWSEKLHGQSEPFWIWVADEEDRDILQLTNLLVHAEPRTYHHCFVVSVPTLPIRLYLRIVSERWFGNEENVEIDLEGLRMPLAAPPTSRLLDIPLFRLSDASDRSLAAMFGNTHPSLTPVMTQCFHTLLHTRANVMLGLASPADTQIAIELAIWRALKGTIGGNFVLVICPQPDLLRRLLNSLRQRFAQTTWAICQRPVELEQSIDTAIFAATPAAAMEISADNLAHRTLRAVIAVDLHLLDAAYEAALADLRRLQSKARFVGLAYPLADCRDLAKTLDVPDEHTYNFDPSTRSENCETSLQHFSSMHSVSSLRAMVAPAFEAIRDHQGAALCITPTRGQCRYIANDLATLIGADLDNDHSGGGRIDLEDAGGRLRDQTLATALVQRVAIWHEGVAVADQRLVLQLLAAGVLKVIVIPRDSIYNVPSIIAEHAALTIVMGTQTIVSAKGASHREVRDYSMGDVVQCANVSHFDGNRKCVIMCQDAQAELYGRYLRTGLPLESTLLQTKAGEAMLRDSLLYQIVRGGAKDKQDLVDLLSWTYLARRLSSNPDFYAPDKQTCSGVVDALCAALRACGLARSGVGESPVVQATELGRRFIMKGRSTALLDDLLAVGSALTAASVDLPLTVEEESLRAWQRRLPRVARERLKEDSPPVTVLFAGWSAGRTPEDTGLEQAQADVIEEMIRLTKAT